MASYRIYPRIPSIWLFVSVTNWSRLYISELASRIMEMKIRSDANKPKAIVRIPKVLAVA
jgi:hypothetical protein